MTLDETFKAAKAGDLTNDTTYKVGEISRKTGLQKQPDGSWAPPKGQAKKPLTRQDNTILGGQAGRTLNNNVQAAGPERDVSAENRAYHEKVEKERADRNARADSKASAARQEAEERHLSGVEMKDFFLAKAYEGTSVAMAQRGLEAQGFDLLEANENVNVYERPEGGRITMQLEGNKIKSADYKTPAETAAEGRAGNEPKPLPTASEEKLNQIRTVHSSEKLGNGQTLELTESKKNGKFFVKIDGRPVSSWKTKEAAQKEFDAYKNGEDPAAARYNEIVGKYNKKYPENPMETKEPENRSAASNELRLKDGQKPSKRSEAFKKPLNKIIESAKTYGDLQEQLIEVLSSWSGENEGYLRNRSLDELANIYVDIRNDYYTDEENPVDFSKGIQKATAKGQIDAAYTAESVNAPRENLERKLTGDCKIRIRK